MYVRWSLSQSVCPNFDSLILTKILIELSNWLQEQFLSLRLEIFSSMPINILLRRGHIERNAMNPARIDKNADVKKILLLSKGSLLSTVANSKQNWGDCAKS